MTEATPNAFPCPVCGAMVIRPKGYSAKQWEKRRTCSPKCAASTLPGSPHIPVELRFHDKYIPEPNSGCWLWEAGCMKSKRGQEQYGTIGIRHGKNDVAHRVSWMLHYGAIPKGMDVMHRCDNMFCVNPEHLKLGTRKENIHDAMNKGRLKRTPTQKYHYWDAVGLWK